MLASIVCLLLLFSLNTISASQPEPSETFTHNAQLEPNGKIHLYWKFNQTYITFEVHGNTNGWVGIGFSPSGSMMGADMSVGWVKNGEATITDRHGVTTGNTYPPLDTEQNVELLGGSECDGWTVLKFRRQLAACDDQDLEITTHTMRVIYAWGLEDPTGDDLSGSDYHTPVRRGVKSLLLLIQPNFKQSRYPEGERHFHFDMRNDKFQVPDEDTYYNCRLFKLPHLTTKHHMVKIEPLIDKGHEMNVHHIVIYQCNDPNLTNRSVGMNTRCSSKNKPADFLTCIYMVHTWAIGGSAFYYPTHAGYPLGTPDAPKYVVMEMHYDNPLRKADIVDSSGLRLTYTPDLRQYDAGILDIGVGVSGIQHIIPPNAKSFYSYGDCTSECLSYSLEREGFASIKAFAVMMHSHTIGKQLTLKHIRNETELEPIASDLTYDFNYQETRFLSEERTVMRSDTLRMTCNYKSTGRAGITMGGLSTSHEMCLSFLYFYPKLELRYCMSTPDFSTLMTYFGFESYSNTGDIDHAFVDLNDITIWQPEKYTNKTAIENINAMQWNEAKVTKFEKDMTTMLSSLTCYGSHYALPFPLQQQEPKVITNPYVNEKEQLNCTEPSSGFSHTGLTDECSARNDPTVAPYTTSSGVHGLYSFNWMFLTLVAAFVQYYTRMILAI
uniref:DBH-like monooxygenase protein 1 homolog n=1 Tax=Phallusia mammillata TaxID=59560 RepID=A0A6F9DLQ4_9ASCI|nr:DBH-like monooxygenase protein 1 homolog [Phallusia mammillata]